MSVMLILVLGNLGALLAVSGAIVSGFGLLQIVVCYFLGGMAGGLIALAIVGFQYLRSERQERGHDTDHDTKLSSPKQLKPTDLL